MPSSPFPALTKVFPPLGGGGRNLEQGQVMCDFHASLRDLFAPRFRSFPPLSEPSKDPHKLSCAGRGKERKKKTERGGQSAKFRSTKSLLLSPPLPLSLSSREEKERCGKGTRARLLLFLLRPYIPPLLPLLLATVQPPLACKTLSSRGPKVKF